MTDAIRIGILLFLLWTCRDGLSDGTVADMQRANEEAIFPHCRKAIWIAKVTLSPTSKSAARSKVCYQEKTLPAAAPCYRVKQADCVKGSCPRIKPGSDLRIFGIVVTDYWFMESYRIYLMKLASQEVKWGATPWDIVQKILSEKCIKDSAK